MQEENTDFKLEIFSDEDEDDGVQTIDPFYWKIPDCCKEGWKSCPHVVKRHKRKKINKGL